MTEHRTHFAIIVGSAKDAIRRWRNQYGLKNFDLACGENAADITRKLNALKRPTIRQVDKIIGSNGWTNIFCTSCHEYKPKVASFGEDYSAEVCEDCLSRALRELRRTKGASGNNP